MKLIKIKMHKKQEMIIFIDNNNFGDRNNENNNLERINRIDIINRNPNNIIRINPQINDASDDIERRNDNVNENIDVIME